MSDVQVVDRVDIIFENLKSFAEGGLPPPFRLFLWPTARCNLRCPSCGIAAGNIPIEMDDATLLDVAGQAIELGVRECYITGGEAMLRKEVVLPFMEQIKKAGIRGMLSTNGTILDEDDLGRIVDMNWDLIIVSLDGPNAQRNDPLRSRQGVFEDVVGLIETLLTLRSGSFPEVYIHMVLSKSNVSDLTKMVELCHSLGVDYFSVDIIVRQSEACEEMMFDEEAYAILPGEVTKAVKLAGKLGLSNNLAFLTDLQVATGPTDTASINAADAREVSHPFAAMDCFVPFYNLVIHPNGQVGGCWRQQNEAGPRFPQITLREAWELLGPRQMREMMIMGKSPDFCSGCCLINARDNRRFRALLLAELGDISEAERALRMAQDAEPELAILQRALEQLYCRNQSINKRNS